MTERMLKCVCCDVQWNKRKDRSYKGLGSKSHSFISKYQLLSNFGKQRIELLFCDVHGNNLKDCTRITNDGVLKIRNITTGRWRKATSVRDHTITQFDFGILKGITRNSPVIQLENKELRKK